MKGFRGGFVVRVRATGFDMLYCRELHIPGREKLGETHPNTLQSMHHLAEVLQAAKGATD